MGGWVWQGEGNGNKPQYLIQPKLPKRATCTISFTYFYVLVKFFSLSTQSSPTPSSCQPVIACSESFKLLLIFFGGAYQYWLVSSFFPMNGRLFERVRVFVST